MTRRRPVRRLGIVMSVGLLVAAVVTELRRPADQRTWHGHVAGVVPYDFRLPTIRRIRDAFWNPADARLFVPHAFGVGWTVNVRSLNRRIRELRHR